jgi:lipopolysaccharide export LptBFGC system permease protein LptF
MLPDVAALQYRFSDISFVVIMVAIAAAVIMDIPKSGMRRVAEC